MIGRRVFSRLLAAIERGSFPRTRKWFWRRLYDLMSWRWRARDWRFMNYGYLVPGASFSLDLEDEPERPFIGLYHQALDGLPVAGARVLEVGSGRGGGARYIARYLDAALVTGLDYSPQTVERARDLNADTANLAFEVGDAEALPFDDESFDVVVNIESSHCYADVSRFAHEAARVLVPGGWFTIADMRGRGMVAEFDRQLEVSGMTRIGDSDLGPGVVAALDAVDQRKRAQIGRLWMLKRFITEFSGARGTMLYNGLVGGQVAYLARRFQKTGAARVTAGETPSS